MMNFFFLIPITEHERKIVIKENESVSIVPFLLI